MKKLEKLTLKELEKSTTVIREAEDQRAIVAGSDNFGYFGCYSSPTWSGSNAGNYDGPTYASPSTNGCNGDSGSYTPNSYTPPQNPIGYPPSLFTGSYATTSAGGCYTGSYQGSYR